LVLAFKQTMKKLIFVLGVISFLTACSTKKIVEAAKPVEILPKPLLTKADSVAYSFGLNVAETFLKIEDDTDGDVKLDIDIFSDAIKEKLGNNPRISDAEMQAVMQVFSNEMMVRSQEKEKQKNMVVKEKGLKFLAANASKAGVKTTASGLQYKVINAGSGISPMATDEVRVHYTGKLIDGTVFDSSVERGEPINFKLNQVIPGWTEGVQLMKKGAKYEFTIPSELAYGERGSGPQIPGGSVLIFEVELLDVIK